VNQIAPLYIFLFGLLAGGLLIPLAKLLAASGLGRVAEIIGTMAMAPFVAIGRLFGSNRGGVGSRDEKSGSQQTKVDDEQLNNLTHALRSIIVSLAMIIHRADQAANDSNQTMDTVRDSINNIDIPKELSEVHQLLMREVNRITSGNSKLKKDLSQSQEELANQKKLVEELRTAVRIDGLTQLANRNYFDEKLLESIKLHQRHNDMFSLLLVDVDHFKEINDKHGHLAGDRILKGVAFNLKSSLRESDFVARFGGDEFAIILNRSDGKAAVEVAVKLCYSQQESRFLLDGSEIKVTISIGITEAEATDTPESLVGRADKALYRVKSEGRNNVRWQ